MIFDVIAKLIIVVLESKTITKSNVESGAIGIFMPINAIFFTDFALANMPEATARA